MAMTAEERRSLLQKYGYIKPDNDGFLGELADSAAQSFIAGGRGLGATVSELTGNTGMQEYFQGVLDRNQQWNAPEDMGVGAYLGRAVGSAAGSTAATLTAATAGSLLGGPKVGLAAGLATAFSQSFGENVQRNREAGYSENKALGMAFLESGVDSVIENLPFGIVGKSGKIIAQAGRLRNISAAGKRELLNKVGQLVAAATGKQETQNALLRLGKSAFMNGLGEGGEEGLQYLNSYVNQALGGDPNANISIEDLANNIAQGFIGGFFLGGAQNTPMVFTNATPPNTPNNSDVLPSAETAPVVDEQKTTSLYDQLVANAGEYLGIKVEFMDNLPEDNNIARENNGMYDSNNKTLYLNRQSATENPVKTLGHELKHYIDDNLPELAKTFDELVRSGLTEQGQAFNENIHDGDMTETISDVFGDIFARPETWAKTAAALDEKSPGMGEAFLKVLRDFIAHIKNTLKGIQQDPAAEQLLNNFESAEAEAVRMLSELRRRNGNASQVENVVGAKGNTAVETVPVADINVDAGRFQFKSNTSKSSGVDESNKLGGDWDPRAAGILYLWEDKNGNLYVVNGHHRLELAQRNGVENINAIIDRESDGITAEQARRNGVLINILDGQGEVRDYASFVRDDKLSEDEAKAQGVTARPKGRAGFLLGKSGDTLYEAYINEVIPESKAVIIAEVANGNEAVEYAGIKLATDRKLAGETLRQTLKLAAQNTSGKKADTEQGGLFDMVDDSVLQEWEAIGKLATKRIDDLKEKIKSRKSAVKNPEAAREGDIKVGKNAEKLLAQAQEELARWENYATDPELMAQLRQEANIVSQEDVAGAENAQTTAEPVVKENLTTEKASENGKSGSELPENGTPEENLEAAPGKDPTVDDFLLRFAPQIDAIIAKNNIKARGNLYDDDLKSIAMTAAAKAYEDFEPGKGAALDTFASAAVKNAITDFNRKQHREFESSGGNVSLQMENDQGNTLEDAVASDDETTYYDEVSARENPKSAKRRLFENAGLTPRETRIAELFEQGLSASEVARSEGVGLTTKQVYQALEAIAEKAYMAGVRYSKKREQSLVKGNLMKIFGSIDQAIKSLYQIAVSGVKNRNSSFVDYAKISDQEKKFLESKTFLDLSGIKYHAIDESGIRHIDNLHGINGTRLNEFSNQIPITEQDYLLIPDIVKSKNVSYAGKDKMGQDLIKYEYYNGDTFYYLEEVRVGREKLSGKTFYKTRGTPVTQVQQNNVAQPLYTRASAETNIPHSGKKSSDNLKFSRKRLHQQINPIVRDGKVRQEYADLLERKGYTPETIEQWDRKAIAWIEKQGGIFPAAQKLLRDQAPTDGAVAELVRRHVLNSDVFETAFDRKERTTLYEQEIAVRSQWGKTGRAMQINALKLDDIASVQALFNKLHEGVPEPELRKLQSDILKSTNIDIFALPADILNNKSKLDEVLRAEMAHKATWTSKLYEYWINAILSGPGTHLGNIFGNTGNAAYELGLKRFAEALVNVVAHRKDGATFGEFKYMLKAVNLGAAKHAFMQALDQELLDVNNKFLENNLTAIGGKTGRFIRIPGRALRAADAFAKAIITPMETAAYAYRMGLQEGIADTAMVEYIQKQMADPESDASLFGLSRAKELTFQEDPGTAVKYLMAMREAPGPLGAVLKTFLPFIKTPANILKQGIRKSPLGVVNLAWETGKAVMKKREFDSDLVARAAEQLLAWGSFALLYGLSGDDDDELPFITGSSAAYGSAEYAFKANKVPPYSIRIGGNYYSYAKIEPLATGLALMADAIAGFRAAKNGKTGQNILSRLLESSKKIIVEKSYLDSIGEISKIAEDPERHATRYFSNLAASAVPNIATQVLKSFDENVPDNKNREIGEDFWKEQFFVVTNQAGLTTALPKIDYFGREVKKDAWGDSLFSALARLQPIRKIKADGNMDNAEKLIWNYNQQGAETPYYPSIPRNTFNINGKKMYFAGEDYKEYAVLAGELAHRQINNAIRAGRLNVNNPTERDIKLIKQVFTKSRKIIQMRMVQQRKAKEY